MDTKNKKDDTNSKCLIHLYDDDDAWVAYERSAYLLSFAWGDDVRICSAIAVASKQHIVKAEIMKKDFKRLVSPFDIIQNEAHYKILDLHISQQEFEAWMDNKTIKP